MTHYDIFKYLSIYECVYMLVLTNPCCFTIRYCKGVFCKKSLLSLHQYGLQQRLLTEYRFGSHNKKWDTIYQTGTTGVPLDIELGTSS